MSPLSFTTKCFNCESAASIYWALILPKSSNCKDIPGYGVPKPTDTKLFLT